MSSDELVALMLDALNASGVNYMVTGSLASNLHGISRMTKDADFVLELKSDEIPKLAKSLRPTLRLDEQMAFETVTSTFKHVFRPADSNFMIELFELSDDLHDRERFHRRRPTTMHGRPSFLPTPEDVVIQKLRWSKQGARSKDIADARNVLAVQGDALDFPYIESWCGKHGTLDLLNQIRTSLPPEPRP